jgi:hypothetical protein
MRKSSLALACASAVVLSLGTLTPAIAVSAAPAPPNHSTQTDVGVLAWCTNLRPESGSIPYGPMFAGNTPTQACQKCDEWMRREQAQGRISSWACEYLEGLGYVRGYAKVIRA